MTNKIYCAIYRDRISDGQRVKVGEAWRTVGQNTWEEINWYISVSDWKDYYYTSYDSDGNILNV